MSYRYVLRSRCPACGKGTLYEGLLNVAKRCDVCQFPLQKHDAGDGPAFFAMVFSSCIVVVAALIVDALLTVPLWLHVVIWGVVIILLSIYFLRVVKAFLLYQEYKHNVGGYKKDDTSV
jgi:uncharacterized protein (DUF983 family)